VIDAFVDRGDADDRGNANDIRSRFSSDRCRIEAIQAPCPNFRLLSSILTNGLLHALTAESGTGPTFGPPGQR